MFVETVKKTIQNLVGTGLSVLEKKKSEIIYIRRTTTDDNGFQVMAKAHRSELK